MFCQNNGSIPTHGWNPHKCCSDGRTGMKQIVPNSGSCSTTSKWLRSQLQMVRVAHSRNHQTQNTQRSQQDENCRVERSWSTSLRASWPQRAGGRPDRMPAKHDHWTDGMCAGWKACRMLNLSSGVEIQRQNQRENCTSFGPGHDVLGASALLFSTWQKH